MRYTRGMVPFGGIPEERQIQGGVTPLQAAVLLGEAVRAEHGREGVGQYVCALSPLLPRQLVEKTAHGLGIEPPPPEPPRAQNPPPQQQPPPPREKRQGGGIQPEQLLQLMQGMKQGEGGGLDPLALLKLMQK